MVPHPFTYSQRIDGDMECLCSFFGYEEFGYTNPNEKVPEWNSVGKIIPLQQISSIKFEPFTDRPAIWREGDDHTAYKLFIETK